MDRSKAPSSSASSGIIEPPPIGTTTSGKFFKDQCNNNSLTCASFPTCHGSNSYWGTTNPAERCYYTIPVYAIASVVRYGVYSPAYTGETGNPICARGRPAFSSGSYNAPEIRTDGSNSGSDYGYAADYKPNCTDVDRNIAYAPGLVSDPSVTSWQVRSSFSTGNLMRGCGVLLTNNSGSSTYTLLLLHLAYTGDPSGASACSGYIPGVKNVGDAIGHLFTTTAFTWSPHIHVELKVGGSIVRPEGGYF